MWTQDNVVRLIAGVIFLAGAVLIVTVARGHSWYEAYCCNNQDCGPAVSADYQSGGLRIEIAPGQWMPVPAGMTLRPSVDANWHVCVFHGEVRCVYAPAGA